MNRHSAQTLAAHRARTLGLALGGFFVLKGLAWLGLALLAWTAAL